MAFKPGDVVKLKSGGPKMTVAKIDNDGSVDCEWFDEKNIPQVRAFTATSLEPYVSPSQRTQGGGGHGPVSQWG